MITRRDFRGGPKDWLIWGPLLFGPPLLELYGLRRFQILLDPDDRLLFRASLVGYGVAFVVCLAFQTKLFPWARKAPGMKWLGVFVIPVVGATLGACVFTFGNALLDRSKGKETVRLIDRRSTPTEYSLMSERRVVTGERLQVRRGTPQLPAGARVVLNVRNGRFGAPWIASYKIQP
jgi:hypothetical protein